MNSKQLRTKFNAGAETFGASDLADLLDEAIVALEKSEQWVADLQSGMYINCVYCGHRYGPEENTPSTMADVLKAHIQECPEHPLSKTRNALQELLGACEIAAVMPKAIGKTLDMSMDSAPLRAAREALSD